MELRPQFSPNFVVTTLLFTGVEMQCIGSFKLLFYLLRVQLSTGVQSAALEVVNIVTTNQECVNDIAASEVLASLLLVIPSLPKSTILILETLYALISNTKIVKELMLRGKYKAELTCVQLLLKSVSRWCVI